MRADPSLGLSQPTVSHHLKKLVQAGLLQREQRGVWAYYSLDREGLERAATRPRPEGSQRYEHDRRPRAGARALRGGGNQPLRRLRLRMRLREHRLLRRGGDDTLRPGSLRSRRARGLPENAVAASLGCGNPVAVAEMHEGETVLDLGSGGGIDVLLSARRVGPTGTVYGLDMTDEMLALAERNARKADVTNVHFLKGLIEEIPLEDASVDVVISNCVVNLSPEKPRVLAEIVRVLRPGGRVGISDVVAEDRLTSADRAAARKPRRLHRRRALRERVPRGARGGRARRCRGGVHARGRGRHARSDRPGTQAGLTALSRPIRS